MFKKRLSTYLEIASLSDEASKKMWIWEKRGRGLGGADKMFLLVSALELQRSHPHQFKYRLFTVTLDLQQCGHSLH